MLVKNVLVPLLGLAVAAEAASVHSYRSVPGNGLVRRQNRFQGKGKTGQNGNNNNNNNGQNNNNNNNNNGQNNNNNNGQNNNNNGQNNNNNNNGQNNNQASVTCLAANALQTASQQTGQNGQAADGQVESATDQANFINFCAGQVLTNGLQNRDGSCNGIPMGKIPSVNNMVTTIITSPLNFQVLPPEQTFTVQLQVNNMVLGSFTNATSTYYTAPQDLAGNGNIIGHTHITVQDAGNSINPSQPLDARQFVFFKGVNDAGNGNGGLSADVVGGLPEGFYRFCTMSSASNHQPVLMPVAQRGTSEDCKYVAVSNDPNILLNQLPGVDAGAGAGAGQNNNNNNQNNGQNNNDNQNNGQNNNNNNQNNGQNNNNNQNNGQQNNGQQNNGQQNGQKNNGQKNNGQGKQQKNQGNQNNGQQNNGQQNNGQQQGQQQGGGKGKADGQQAKGKADGQQAKGQQGGGQQGAQQAGQQGGQQNNNAGGGNSLGGVAAPQVENVGGDRPFVVNGNSFATEGAAVQRACAIQNNACANAANSGADFSVQDCNQQEQACRAAAAK